MGESRDGPACALPSRTRDPQPRIIPKSAPWPRTGRHSRLWVQNLNQAPRAPPAPHVLQPGGGRARLGLTPTTGDCFPSWVWAVAAILLFPWFLKLLPNIENRDSPPLEWIRAWLERSQLVFIW